MRPMRGVCAWHLGREGAIHHIRARRVNEARGDEIKQKGRGTHTTYDRPLDGALLLGEPTTACDEWHLIGETDT